jgi:hypothetical protein
MPFYLPQCPARNNCGVFASNPAPEISKSSRRPSRGSEGDLTPIKVFFVYLPATTW